MCQSRQARAMNRRLVVAGALLLALFLASTSVGVVAWEAELSVTENEVESAEEVRVDDLLAECRPVARSLAPSENVSIREYRVGVGPAETMVRHTPATGWERGDTSCVETLAFENNLHVGGEAYNVRGHASKETLHRRPAFGGAQVLVAVVGLGLVVLGATRSADG